MECRCQYVAHAESDRRSGGTGKLSRLFGFLTKRVRTRGHTLHHDPEQKRDLYELHLQGEWDLILSSHFEGEQILSACERAVHENDLAGAMNLVFIMSMCTSFDYSKSPSLNAAWKFVFEEAVTRKDIDAVMDILAHAEKDKHFEGAKTLLNMLIKSLITRQPHLDTNYSKEVIHWCQKKGHFSFGFDVAMSSGNFQEAFSMLTSIMVEGEDHVMMIQDMVAHRRNDSMAASFADYCFVRGSVELGFSLATALKLWSEIEKKTGTDVTSPRLLRPALRASVLAEKWDMVRLLLEHLSQQDVRDELLSIPNAARRVNMNALTDLLLELNCPQLAAEVTCSIGNPLQVKQIVQKTGMVMDHKLYILTAKACFDSHCSPEEFLETQQMKRTSLKMRSVRDETQSMFITSIQFKRDYSPEDTLEDSWTRDLLLHILEAPRRKHFSKNQWACVLTLVDAGLPQSIALELASRAVEEDAACLDKFINKGLNDSLLEVLLLRCPERALSDNHLNCLVKLLYKDAGIDMTDVDKVLTEEAVLVAETRKKGTDSVDKAKNPLVKDASSLAVAANSDVEEAKNRSALRRPESYQGQSDDLKQEPDTQKEVETRTHPGEEDWSTAVLLLSGHPVCPWWYVMKAAQAARDSTHIRHLAVRTAEQGLWNCLICLSLQGLHQNPVDLLLSLLHKHPEKLVQRYIREKEQWVFPDKDIRQKEQQRVFPENYARQKEQQWIFPKNLLKKGWRKGFPYTIDIMNLQSRDLLEERHRMLLLGQVLASEDWSQLMTLSSLDLPLYVRRMIFQKSMRERQWSLAKEVFQYLPDLADPKVVNSALKTLTETSEQLYRWMTESGLCNAYLAPEMYSRQLTAASAADEKEAKCKEKKSAKSGPNFLKRFITQPQFKVPIGFHRPNPAVVEKDRHRVTSTLGKVVQEAATRGQWNVVMKVYEGGMGEAVKMAVIHEALGQCRWTELNSLIRRDPEADLFYPRCTRQIMTVALDHGAWHCLEALVEKLATQEDREWLFPYALHFFRWTLVMALVRRGVRAELREEAQRLALQRNEWSFVMDCTLHLVYTSPEDLRPGLKKAIVKSMTNMIATMMPPASATTFGLHLCKKGHSQGQAQDTGVQHGGPTREGEREDEDEEVVDEDWTTEDGSTVFQVAARLRLWNVCEVLMHCGVDPHPLSTPSHPHDIILLALRHQRPDIIQMVLNNDARTSGITTNDVMITVMDLAVREMLMMHTLSLEAEVGLALLRKLLERRLGHSSTSCSATTTSTTTTATTMTTTTTTLQSDVSFAKCKPSSSDTMQFPGADAMQSPGTDIMQFPGADIMQSSSSPGDVAKPVREDVHKQSSTSVTRSSNLDGTRDFNDNKFSSDLIEPSGDALELSVSITESAHCDFMARGLSGDVTKSLSSDITQQTSKNGTMQSPTDISAEARTLIEQVCHVLEAGAERQPKRRQQFQPCVSDAVYSQRIALPPFLSFFSLVDRGVRPREMKQLDDGLYPESSDVDDNDNVRCDNERDDENVRIPPRRAWNVEKEPRPSPMLQLFPDGQSVCCFGVHLL